MYVPLHKDLSDIEVRYMWGMTKRQLICFGIAAGLGLPVYLFTRRPLGNTTAMLLLILVALPPVLIALYRHDGVPLERLITRRIMYMKHPKCRPYQTRNYYSLLQEQYKLEQEVKKIVQGHSTQCKTKKSNQKAPTQRRKG